MNRFLIISMFLLAGCATTETVLKNKSGNFVTCGGSSVGSLAGGYIGYSIQKDMDEKCVQDNVAQGYRVVN